LRDKAVALRILGRAEEELACVEQIAESSPEDKHVLLRLADLHLELGRFKESINLYDRVLNLDSSLVPALIHRAIALSLSERWTEAIKSAEQATKIAPENPEAWLVLGDVNLRAERYKAASKALERAARLRPQDASIEHTMGLVAFKAGRLKDAVMHFRRAIALKRDFARAMKYLALAYMELEDWKKASDMWLRFVRVVRDDPKAWDAYATTCARLNDFCTAHDAWDHARRLFKKMGAETEAERVARLGRAARINCSRLKKAARAEREKEKLRRRHRNPQFRSSRRGS